MKITIYGNDNRQGDDQTYAGNGGSNGLFLHVKGSPADIRFDSVSEAYEIAGAILAGLHVEIERATQGRIES